MPNAPDAARFPTASRRKPAPYGVSFTGLACSEPRLIALAYAFEQATEAAGSSSFNALNALPRSALKGRVALVLA